MHDILKIKSVSEGTATCFDVFISSSGILFQYTLNTSLIYYAE
jgi:hypothetical protein